jgi:chemotaxis protein CheZ
LHVNAFGPPPARVTRELDAVVESAEQATEQILSAAEDIEDAANTLSASLKREQEQSLALDIQDNVLRIFEGCNFQDLSGQRIAKVLTTLKFVEERIAHMIEIWGGIDAFGTYAVAATAELDRVAALHGPKLDGEDGHATQDDVDALFATG